MKNKTGLLIAIFLIAAFGARFAAAGPSAANAVPAAPPAARGLTPRSKITGAYFGTASVLCVYDDFSRPDSSRRLERLWADVKELLEEVERAISASVPDSDIARFNDARYGESVTISLHTARVIAHAKELHDLTGGLFDPTVSPLVDLWGFTPRFGAPDYQPERPYDRARGETGFALPDERYIEAFLRLVDFDGVILTGDESSGYRLTKLIPPAVVDAEAYEAALDLGGIGKGYAADLALELISAYGYEYGYFSCGGSSMTMLRGMSEDPASGGASMFELGVRKPRPGMGESSNFVTLYAGDTALSTSGDYYHAYMLDGTVYCHIISPRTGYPMNTPAEGGQKGIASATVVGGSAVVNEGITTAMCLMGLEEGLDFMNRELKDFFVVLTLYKSGERRYEIVTNIPDGGYAINDEAYTPAGAIDEAGNVSYIGSILSGY